MFFDVYLGVAAYLLNPPCLIWRKNSKREKVTDVLFYPGNPNAIPIKFNLDFSKLPYFALINIICEIGNFLLYFDILTINKKNIAHHIIIKLKEYKNETINRLINIFQNINLDRFNYESINELLNYFLEVDTALYALKKN